MKEQRKSIALKEELESLKNIFELALNDKDAVSDFILNSKKLAIKKPDVQAWSFEMADYTTKILIERVRDGDFAQAKNVFDNYVDNLLPVFGLSEKSSDVASNALILGIVAKKNDICKRVFEKILGSDFSVTAIENNLLLFNLACYYAINREKDKLLLTIKQALKKGVKSGKFLTDLDFKEYWGDSDFICILNDSVVSHGKDEDLHDARFELIIKLSAGEALCLNARYADWDVFDKKLPIYELLDPKNVLVELVFLKGNSGVVLINNARIEDLSAFLNMLKKSAKLTVGDTQVIPTVNDSFSFGVKHISTGNIVLYNALHVEDISYVVNHDLYVKEVETLIARHKKMQLSLREHIRCYFDGPLYSQEVNGLIVGLKGKKLLVTGTKKHLFQIELKNISNKSIYFIDNICVKATVNYEINIMIDSRPEEHCAGMPGLELKQNESMMFDVEVTVAFVNRVCLHLNMTNTFPMMSNMSRKTQLDAIADDKFSHMWHGSISHDVSVFTIDKAWQKMMATNNDFDAWIANS